MNIKLRLNLVISSLLLLVMLAGILLSFNNARKNAIAEITSAEKLTQYLFDASIANQHPSNFVELDRGTFKLERLAHLRHLNIQYLDNAGKVLDTNQVSKGNLFQNKAPAWFERLLNNLTPTWQPSILPLEYQNRHLGKLVVTPDPTFEYAEIWKQITDLLLLLSIFFISVNLIISWAITQALNPTEDILLAFDEIEKGHLATRLPTFKLIEMDKIGQKFNRTIEALQLSIAQNHKLTQQLITLQEEERKSIARDLHDEFGQCLTAIHTDASVVLMLADCKYPELRDSALAMKNLSRHLMDLVSGLLLRLRPGVLDELGLKVGLQDLVDNWRLRNENTLCTFFMNNADEVDGANLYKDFFGQSESLALYRLVQECLTNISRHANASHVKINLDAQKRGEKLGLSVTVNDNGKGFKSVINNGLGLHGMRERVLGLGGELVITSHMGIGTTVIAWIPSMLCEVNP